MATYNQEYTRQRTVQKSHITRKPQRQRPWLGGRGIWFPELPNYVTWNVEFSTKNYKTCENLEPVWPPEGKFSDLINRAYATKPRSRFWTPELREGSWLVNAWVLTGWFVLPGSLGRGRSSSASRTLPGPTCVSVWLFLTCNCQPRALSWVLRVQWMTELVKIPAGDPWPCGWCLESDTDSGCLASELNDSAPAGFRAVGVSVKITTSPFFP